MKTLRHLWTASVLVILATLLGFNIIITYQFIKVDSLLDFGSFVASGKAIASGEDPYTSESDLIFHVTFWDGEVGGKMPNLNPPVSLLAFQYLAYTNPYSAIFIWRIVSIALYIASLLVLFSLYRPINSSEVLWALCLGGFWHTIELGQIYTFLLFCLALAWYFNEKGNPILAGFLLGLLIAVKPNFIVMLPFLFIGKQNALGLSALISFGLLSLIPALIWGFSVYEQWFAASQISDRVLVMPGNSSLLAFTARLGITNVGFVSTIVLLAVVFFWCISKKTIFVLHKRTVWAIGIILSLFVSPISWAGYTIFTLPLFLAQKNWKVWMRVAAIILATPFFVILTNYESSKFGFIFWGGWYGWGLLFLLIDIYHSHKINAALSTTVDTLNAIPQNLLLN